VLLFDLDFKQLFSYQLSSIPAFLRRGWHFASRRLRHPLDAPVRQVRHGWSSPQKERSR